MCPNKVFKRVERLEIAAWFIWEHVGRLHHSFRVHHFLQQHQPGVEELAGAVGNVGVLQSAEKDIESLKLFKKKNKKKALPPLLRHLVPQRDGPVEGVEEGLLAAARQKLHQHEVVGELLLVEQHGAGEAHGANEEGQPELGDRRRGGRLPGETAGQQLGQGGGDRSGRDNSFS